jgi:Flp pilus assembly protein TadG
MLQLPRTFLRAGINRVRAIAGADPLDEKASIRGELKQAGQIVVIFALMLTVLIGLIGIAIDTTYAWRESLRVQRASDAAALAGVVYMPGALATAQSTAGASAKQNGFPVNGTITTVNAVPAANPRELDVTITTQVPTFFSRIFGINNFTVSRMSKAVYVTPVPMGSPLGYYGVYQMCPVSGSCTAQSSPSGVTVGSQGFFGAIEGEGSNTSTGDAFAPYYNGNPTLNTAYTADGYRYSIISGGAGTVYLYDPIFCATSTMASGAHAGAGDHWLGTPVPVSTYYILWDTHNLPLAPALWTKAAELDETNQNMTDQGTTYGSGGNYADSGTPSSPTNCASNPQHNAWVSLGAVTASDTYSLQVTTTTPGNPTANRTQNFENMFSIAVSGGGQIYGAGSMETYANVTSGAQEFYLAQIDQTAGAGKTIEIDLFDPGDTAGPSWLQVEPDGTPAWQPTTFSYTSSNGRSNSSTNCVQTEAGGTGASPPSGCGENASSGGTLYNNAWVHIMVTLPTTYGDASHPLSQNGWWKIKYTVSNASDTTTWQVSILGNPVHLI